MEEEMRKNTHAIEELFALLDQFGSYPNGVKGYQDALKVLLSFLVAGVYGPLNLMNYLRCQ
jgi:hypothetical protein